MSLSKIIHPTNQPIRKLSQKSNISVTHNEPHFSDSHDWVYHLKVLEHPNRARRIGFSQTERRNISPIPILKLVVENSKGISIDIEKLDPSKFIVQVSILQVDGTDASILVCPSSTSDSPKTKMWNLVGAREANAEKFLDIDHKTGLFFVFKDLSVRAEGVFRLNFSLINLSEYNFSASLLHDSFQVPNVIRDNVMSNPFEVYSPHGFPGMLGPSDRLTYFRAQGLHIHFRKPGVRKANIKENPPSDDERNHVRFIST